MSLTKLTAYEHKNINILWIAIKESSLQNVTFTMFSIHPNYSTKSQENVISSQRIRQLTDANFKMTQILSDMDFKTATITVLNEIKENINRLKINGKKIGNLI